MEYETQFALGPLCGVEDPARLLAAAAACDKLGLNTISAGGTLAFAMECAEKGLVDWPLRFGDELRPLARAHRPTRGPRRLPGRRDTSTRGRDRSGQRRLRLPREGPRAPGLRAPGDADHGARAVRRQPRRRPRDRSGAYQADLRPGVDRWHADPARAPALVIETEDLAALLDSLILCKFLRGAVPEPWREGAELLTMVTGVAHDADALHRAVAPIAE